eukprot:1555901-Rhodomonas_salina.1
MTHISTGHTCTAIRVLPCKLKYKKPHSWYTRPRSRPLKAVAASHRAGPRPCVALSRGKSPGQSPPGTIRSSVPAVSTGLVVAARTPVQDIAYYASTRHPVGAHSSVPGFS